MCCVVNVVNGIARREECSLSLDVMEPSGITLTFQWVLMRLQLFLHVPLLVKMGDNEYWILSGDVNGSK